MAITQVTSNVIEDNTIKPNKLTTGHPTWDTAGNLSATAFVGDGSRLSGTTNILPDQTIIRAITGNKIPGTITAQGFIGDGSLLTGTTPALQVLEVTDTFFSVEPVHNNTVILLNSSSTINVDTPFNINLTPGHKTYFVQTNTGRGRFLSQQNFNVDNFNATKQQYSVCELEFLDYTKGWSLYGDLTSVPGLSSYSLTSNLTSVNEGALVTITLNTADIPNMNVPYTVTGTINNADLSGNSAGITGNFNLVNNTGSVLFALSSDSITEGTEFINLQLNNGQAAIAVQVNDTSINTSYSLTRSLSSSSVNEGTTVVVTLSTVGLVNGTNVPYYVQSWGTGYANAADFDTGSDALTGNFTINTNQATKTFIIKNDELTEGGETFFLTLCAGQASTSVLILDTSYFAPKFTRIIANNERSIALSGNSFFSTGWAGTAPAVQNYSGLDYQHKSTFTRYPQNWIHVLPGLNMTHAISSNGAIFAVGELKPALGIGINSGGDRSSFTRITQTRAVPGDNFTLTSFLSVTRFPEQRSKVQRTFVLSGDSLFGAGSNTYYQLGFGVPATDQSYFIRIGKYNFNKISSGSYGTVALSGNKIFAAGMTIAVGAPSYLGTYLTTFTILPNISSIDFIDIEANSDNFGAYYLAKDNTLYYGVNNNITPVLSALRGSTIVLNPKFSAVSSHFNNAFALSGTELYAYGNNLYGTHGDGTTTSKSLFTRVPGNWIQVSAGSTHTHALSTNNTLFGTGTNFYGELGLGNTGFTATFTQITGVAV